MSNHDATGLPADPDPTETEYDDHVGDVLAWIADNADRSNGPGVDRSRPSVLEVNQVWEDALLDTRHFTRRSAGRDVTIGASLGYRWRLLGIDMGWVPAPLRLVLPYTPPLWSEVDAAFKSDFFAPDEALVEADQVLFAHDLEAESYTAVVDAKWDGFVDTEERRYTFAELVEEGLATREGSEIRIPMREGHRLLVDVGGLVFFSHLVDPGRRMMATAPEADFPAVAIGSLVAFLGLMFGVIVGFAPAPPEVTLDDLDDNFAQMVMQVPDKPEEKKAPDATPDAGEGAKAKGAEGTVGKKDAHMKKARGSKVEVAKQELDRQIAENAGALGAIRDLGGMDGIFGSSALDASITGGIGGLIGAKGTQIGSGGLGSRGSLLGGGGTAEGIGGLGTKGPGTGRNGYGIQGGSLGTKEDRGPGSAGGTPVILGALDRSLIDEVIKRHLSQIRYCYQRELTRSPGLQGKATVKFVIAGDGTVSSAGIKTSTLGNDAVGQCLQNRFMTMRFPEPKGGGIVIVSYPFLFAPG